MRRATYLAAALCAVACSRGHVCDGGELSLAKTSAAERTALARISAQCNPLSVAARDKSGAALPLSDPAWTTKVQSVRIGAGQAPFEHVVIDGKNVLVLLNE